MLSGLRSGGITVQGIRAGEGDIMAYYKEHDNAISVIKLDDDERSAISGSWDKTIIDWDLETGKPKRKFLGAQSQISSIEWQPVGGSLIPREIGEASLKVGLKGSINGDGPSAENGKSKKTVSKRMKMMIWTHCSVMMKRKKEVEMRPRK